MSFNYIVAILKDAGFTKAQLKPATPIHINKVFSDYLNSCEWSEEWFFSIDPSQLDGEQLKLYDSAKELYDAPHNEVLSDTEDMMITLGLQLGVAECEDKALLVKFSEFYALCVYYHTMKHLHSIDIWANGDAHVVYASRYSKALLSHYGYDDDEYLVDTSFEKDFSDVVGKLVHDPYDLWVIAHMTSKLVNDYRDELNECLWYAPYKAELIENFNKYVPKSSNSQYIIACDVEVVEPVHHDVKLDDVELPVIEPVEVVPQEVVEEPQEDLSTTTLNEDTVMNTSTFIPSWEVSGYVSILNLDFGTYSVVESEPVVEVVKPHYSDKWFGQCCDLNDNPEFTQWDIVRTGKPYFPEVVEFTGLPKRKPSIMNIGRNKIYFPIILTPEQLDNAKAKVEATFIKAERTASLASPVRCGSPTVTTKSGKVVQVSPHCVAPYGNAPIANRITSPKVTSAIGEAEAVVTEFKSTLFNLNNYDIMSNIVVDVATTTPATPKATVTPKTPVSTAKFANNFNSLVMAKYRELNGGIVRDSLVLNKLTSALRANDVEAYTKYVTTFNNPQAVSLHRQAYDAVVSAS